MTTIATCKSQVTKQLTADASEARAQTLKNLVTRMPYYATFEKPNALYDTCQIFLKVENGYSTIQTYIDKANELGRSDPAIAQDWQTYLDQNSQHLSVINLALDAARRLFQMEQIDPATYVPPPQTAGSTSNLNLSQGATVHPNANNFSFQSPGGVNLSSPLAGNPAPANGTTSVQNQQQTLSGGQAVSAIQNTTPNTSSSVQPTFQQTTQPSSSSHHTTPYVGFSRPLQSPVGTNLQQPTVSTPVSHGVADLSQPFKPTITSTQKRMTVMRT